MSGGIVLLLVLAGLAIFIVVALRKGWMSSRAGSFTGMAVYHDWLNQDAQRGTEVIIKRNAGEKESEDESGEPFV